MSVEITALIIWGGFLLLMALGCQIAFAMLVTGVLGYVFFVGAKGLSITASVAYNVMTMDLYLAIPLFIFMAAIFQASGLSSRLYEIMYKWMSGVRGGLAIGTILVATLIGAMTGLAGTATVTLGMLAYPEMEKRGYNKIISIGPIISGGALGLIIPPSITMILVGSMSGISVGKLFMAGVMPGLLAAFAFITYIAVRCSINPNLAPAVPAAERITLKEKFASLTTILPPLGLILLVLGGIWFGVFTATEAGGIGAIGSLLYTIATGKLTWKTLREAGNQTLKLTGMVMWLAVAGVIFTSLNTRTGTGAFISESLGALSSSPFVMMLILVAIVIVLGFILETFAIVISIMPIMLPIVIKIGIDPLLFGFCFALALIIGVMTPPFGYAIFYFAGLKHPGVTVADIYKATMVFAIILTVVLLLCLTFPGIVTWFPNALIK
jgi:tripartite ATP-independent transporter DctM subunit